MEFKTTSSTITGEIYPIWIFNQYCPIDVFLDPSEYMLNF